MLPAAVQVDLMCDRRLVLVTEPVVLMRQIALMGVVGAADGTFRRMRETIDASRRTGHNKSSEVRWCVLRSFFVPFFWFSNVKVTRSAEARLPVVWAIMELFVALKTTPRSLMMWVRPGVRVVVHSQDLIAKK